MKLEYDYKIENGWGKRITWSDKGQFLGGSLASKIFDVSGHQPIIPCLGQTLLGEFEKSFILFEFVEVEALSDPPDLFLAKVRPIHQEMKETIR